MSIGLFKVIHKIANETKTQSLAYIMQEHESTFKASIFFSDISHAIARNVRLTDIL